MGEMLMKTSKFLKFNSRNIKSKIDKIYFDKLNFKVNDNIKKNVLKLVKEKLMLPEYINREINVGILYNATEEAFCSYLKENITNSDFLCLIIEDLFEFTTNYYDSFISLCKLATVIELSGVYLSEKYLYEVIEKSIILKENLKNIALTKKDDILKGKLDKIIKNDTMRIFVSIYLFYYCLSSYAISDEEKKYITKTDDVIREKKITNLLLRKVKLKESQKILKK